MIRSTVVALCCLAGMQNLSEPAVRLGEARYLTDTDWAGIREALGTTRVPWVINVSNGPQVGPFKWHANAYLFASVVRDDLRRGPLVDLEATYQGGRRIWRDLHLDGAWAQVALSPDGLRDDFVESDRARPFIVRGEFTDAEIRAIVTAIRLWQPTGGDQRAAGLGPLVGLGRRGPTAAEAQLEGHVFATLLVRNGRWVIVSTRVVIA
jgi:hypothetical protein